MHSMYQASTFPSIVEFNLSIVWRFIEFLLQMFFFVFLMQFSKWQSKDLIHLMYFIVPSSGIHYLYRFFPVNLWMCLFKIRRGNLKFGLMPRKNKIRRTWFYIKKNFSFFLLKTENAKEMLFVIYFLLPLSSLLSILSFSLRFFIQDSSCCFFVAFYKLELSKLKVQWSRAWEKTSN